MRRAVVWGFVGYAALAGGAVVLEQSLALPWPPLLRSALHDVIAFFVFGAYGVLRKSPRPLPGRLLPAAAWITVIFSAASVVFAMLEGQISGAAVTLVFASVPFLTVFIQAQRVGGDSGQLAPAIVGLGGLALIVPFAFPRSPAGIVALAVMVVCAGVVAFAGVRAHDLLAGVPLTWAASGACAAAGVLTAVAWVGQRESTVWDAHLLLGEIAWGVAINVPLVLLTLWLLREMTAVAFATRFTLVPLVTIAAGIVLVRPQIVWTTWLGLALTGVSVWMLVQDEEEV